MRAASLIILASVSTLGVAYAATIQPPANSGAGSVFSSVYYDRTAPLAAKSANVAANAVVTPIGSALGPGAIYSTNEQLAMNPAVSDASYSQPALGNSRVSGPGDYSGALDPDLAYLMAARYGRRVVCAGCPGTGGGGGYLGGAAGLPGAGITGGSASAGAVENPESVSFLLMGIGLFAVGVLGRKRRRSAVRS